MAEIFAGGSLTIGEAAKLLQTLTGAHRTSCYRALNPDGRFARHFALKGQGLAGNNLVARCKCCRPCWTMVRGYVRVRACARPRAHRDDENVSLCVRMKS